MRHFRTILDLAPEEVTYLVELALQLKAERRAGKDKCRVSRRTLGLLFEKPSLRTRVSFETAFAHLGGTSIFLTGAEVGLGKRESIADVGRVMSTYVDLLAVRTFSHDIIVELAANADCPIINALSDWVHPCQALADICTIKEHFGSWKGIRFSFVGDGNNVARSLAFASLYTGMNFTLSSPQDYAFSDEFLQRCQGVGGSGSVGVVTNVIEAVADADIVYTDVWASMGQEAEQAERRKVFAPYQVNRELLSKAKPTARFLHCLPAHRGEEVTDEVLDGPQSLVIEQAANRMHAQKALMLWLLTETG